MPLEDLEEQKRRFLTNFDGPDNPPAARGRALQDAVVSAVHQNALFAPRAKASDRYEVVATWKELLEQYASEYVEPISSERYDKDLVRMVAHMNRTFGHHFRQARHPKFGYEPGFRISHAQMSLGLILKHFWCLGLVAMPPQCPVSRAALLAARAGELNSKWTDVNSIEAHRLKIVFLAKAAQDADLTLAEWELKTLNAK